MSYEITAPNFFDSGFRKQILSVGANTLAFGLQILAGIVVMLVATYFFLIDGAAYGAIHHQTITA